MGGWVCGSLLVARSVVWIYKHWFDTPRGSATCFVWLGGRARPKFLFGINRFVPNCGILVLCHVLFFALHLSTNVFLRFCHTEFVTCIYFPFWRQAAPSPSFGRRGPSLFPHPPIGIFPWKSGGGTCWGVLLHERSAWLSIRGDWQGARIRWVAPS